MKLVVVLTHQIIISSKKETSLDKSILRLFFVSASDQDGVVVTTHKFIN
jgi:hypothetical protein